MFCISISRNGFFCVTKIIKIVGSRPSAGYLALWRKRNEGRITYSFLAICSMDEIICACVRHRYET